MIAGKEYTGLRGPGLRDKSIYCEVFSFGFKHNDGRQARLLTVIATQKLGKRTSKLVYSLTEITLVQLRLSSDTTSDR
ncbi:MAG: hypothetical protein BECKG1743D_GA0114223_107782 [Candidatus Kentron sp. G]|nr:MAG: hypothetical protein BECKG1743E_GA0114224_106344 [Candidatus Kentron sp. G]VFN05856.1 MAG: hypothetical protein BECKG1743D_GA0114223_107782 [Candidatus Kentron sp. G]VFN05985.1 MAG: hypothetical protein BECKG1743F_GA0114225_111582 [Candidatus Kentron sp. G]